MRQLHEDYAAAAGSGRYHPLLLTGAYVLDFLVIHRFSDGNGRMSRLLTLLLLYRHGYEVGRFVSLERLVAATRDVLRGRSKPRPRVGRRTSTTSSRGSGSSSVSWSLPTGEFESRVAAWRAWLEAGGRPAVRSLVDQSTSSNVADVLRACPGVSVDHIRRTLKRLRKDGVVGPPTRGRNATYKRLLRDDG